MEKKIQKQNLIVLSKYDAIDLFREFKKVYQTPEFQKEYKQWLKTRKKIKSISTEKIQ